MSVTSVAGLARRAAKIVTALVWLVLVPTAVFAQASIAGVVKDAGGTVVAGVTVEATSPVLIEGKRTVITDAKGLYEIVDLRPGIYTVTFTAAGFNTARRDGVELSGTAASDVNAELVKGAVETVRVVADTATVDVRNTTQQAVVGAAVTDNVPTSRNIANAAAAVEPSISLGAAQTNTFNGMGSQDSGGSSGDNGTGASAHGSSESQNRRAGLLITSGVYTTDPAFYAEQVSETAGATGEAAIGGVKTRLVPKDGGNTFKGTVFGIYANDSMQSNNLTAQLQSEGLKSQNAVKRIREFNPGFGGPLLKNKLWFFVAYREQIADNWIGGIFADPNQNVANFTDPNNLLNPGDASLLTQREFDGGLWRVGDGRLTYQLNAKNKLAGTFSTERQCKCPSYISATESSGIYNKWGYPYHMITAEWTSVITRRLLFEAAVKTENGRQGWYPMLNYPEQNPEPWRVNPVSSYNPLGTNPDVIAFMEQSTGIYSKWWTGPFNTNPATSKGERAAVSYVTGTHALKVGFENGSSWVGNGPFNPGPNWRYTLNKGVPNTITLYATPYLGQSQVDANLGIYAQDKWTLKHLTLSGGLRFDYYKSSFPQQTAGPAQLAPTRNVTFPWTPDVSGWKDLSPRMGAVYDLFGNGKTALRASLSKYVTTAGSGQNNPIVNMINTTTRSWKDDGTGGGIKGDFIPQCDLTNPNLNGECAADANTNFGKSVPGQVVDPAILSGWGVRQYNWEFSVSATDQLLPRLTVNVGYFRRWFGNQVTTDNLAVGPSDFSQFSIVSPLNPGLPGGGGQTLSGLYNLNPNKFGVPVQNFLTLADNYGGAIQHWNGFDFTANVPLKAGLQLRGGASTGRTSIDQCAVQAALPELIATATTATPSSYCHQDSPFLTRAAAIFSYTIPKVALQVSGTWTNNPGPLITANYQASNASVQSSLGRPLSGSASNVTVNLINADVSHALYGDRYSQLDMRVARVFRYRSSRLNVNLGLFNLMNASAVTLYSNAFGTFLQPQVTQLGRFVRLGTQFDF
jgi:hypothetical protein